MIPNCANSRPTDITLRTILNLALMICATISRVHSANSNLSCRGFFCVSFVNPFQFLVVQLWWTTKKRFRLQGAPATLAITRQPPKHRTIGYAQRPRYNRRLLARLDAANRPFPQSFQRLVIQPARVVFSHAGTESEPINLVKENMHLLTFRLI